MELAPHLVSAPSESLAAHLEPLRARFPKAPDTVLFCYRALQQD